MRIKRTDLNIKWLRAVVRAVPALLIMTVLATPLVAAASSFTGTGNVFPVVEAQAANDPLKCPESTKEAQPAQGSAPALPEQKTCASVCPQGSCIFQAYINPAIKIVSALVGIGVTISIIIGGIQYASSADSPQKVSAAKQRIVKAIFILLAYFFFLAFMNWIIPGGINGTP